MSNVTIERITEESIEDVAYILRNLRPIDYHEFISAGAIPADLHGLESVRASGEHRYLARYKGRPVFAYGMVPYWPHAMSAWGFGTPDAWRAFPAITRHVRSFQFGRPTRLEVRLPESCVQSIEWMKKAFNAVEEARGLQGLSVYGEPYVQLAAQYN